MIDPTQVSCVIPTHGRPEYLKEAIASVCSQSILPGEILVVSDDAEARTRELISELEGVTTVPVRYVDNSKGPGGASASRNVGARSATGTHLAFLDDDDKWQPRYLQHALAVLDAAQTDCVVTWLTMFRGALEAPGLMIRDGLIASDVAAINPGFTGSNFVITTTAFWAIDGFDADLRVINDGDFVYRLLMAGFTYATNAQFDVLQRKHSDGQLTAATEMRAKGLELYMSKHRQTLRLGDRRYMRLAINRIRYHATTSKWRRPIYLAKGFVNSSPKSVWISVRGWKQRPLWRA